MSILFVFMVGLVVGSFLNVCVYRLPRAGLTLISPLFSFCPACQHRLRIYDNLPLISYILLKGRCRICKTHISPLYPCLEIFTGLLAIATFLKFGASFSALWVFSFFAVLVVISLIDWEHMFIPDSLSIGGMFAALLFSPLTLVTSWGDSLGGALTGGGFIFIVDFLYFKLTKRDGFGGGDMKLFAFIGAALGVKALLLVIFISSLLGALAGLFMLIRNGNTAIFQQRLPFAPYAAAASLVYSFAKDALSFPFWY